MMRQIARIHIRALPHTLSSRFGEKFVQLLYNIVGKLGYVRLARRQDIVVGVVSGIGKWILTLVVEPEWQRKGIGSELLDQIKGSCYVYTQECTRKFYEKQRFIKIFQFGKTVVLWRKN